MEDHDRLERRHVHLISLRPIDIEVNSENGAFMTQRESTAHRVRFIRLARRREHHVQEVVSEREAVHLPRSWQMIAEIIAIAEIVRDQRRDRGRSVPRSCEISAEVKGNNRPSRAISCRDHRVHDWLAYGGLVRDRGEGWHLGDQTDS